MVGAMEYTMGEHFTMGCTMGYVIVHHEFTHDHGLDHGLPNKRRDLEGVCVNS